MAFYTDRHKNLCDCLIWDFPFKRLKNIFFSVRHQNLTKFTLDVQGFSFSVAFDGELYLPIDLTGLSIDPYSLAGSVSLFQIGPSDLSKLPFVLWLCREI